MTKNPKPYRRLRGIGRGVVSYNKLYLGTDHLLSVDSHQTSEEYKRFYYKDIQAVITRKTRTGMILNICLGIVSLLFLLPAFWFDGGGAAFFFITAGIFLLFLFINWFRGPTCATHIMTPVQTAKLSALNRIKNTNRALDRLKLLVESTQGAIPQEALFDIDQGGKPRPVLRGRPRPLRHEHGGFHNLLFCSLLANGTLISLDIFIQSVPLSILLTLVFLAATVFLIIALIKQTGSDLHVSLKAITWSTVGYFVISFIFSYGFMLYLVAKDPGMAHNQWEMMKRFYTLSPLENPWLMRESIFGLSFSFLLGIAGAALTRIFQRAYRRSSSGPPSPEAGSFSGGVADE